MLRLVSGIMVWSTSEEGIDDEACGEFGVEVGAFGRHDIIGEGDIANGFEGCVSHDDAESTGFVAGEGLHGGDVGGVFECDGIATEVGTKDLVDEEMMEDGDIQRSPDVGAIGVGGDQGIRISGLDKVGVVGYRIIEKHGMVSAGICRLVNNRLKVIRRRDFLNREVVIGKMWGERVDGKVLEACDDAVCGEDDHAGIFAGDEDEEAGVVLIGRVLFMVVECCGVAVVAIGDEDIGGGKEGLKLCKGIGIGDEPAAVLDVVVFSCAVEVGGFLEVWIEE